MSAEVIKSQYILHGRSKSVAVLA